MNQRSAAVLATGGALLTAVLLAAAWTLAVANGDANVLNSTFGPDLVVPLSVAAVGAIVVSRRGSNPIGWLFLACGVVDAVRAASAEYAIRGLMASHALPAAGWMAWLGNWVLSLIFPTGGLLFILLLFPNGHVLSPRWRILGWAAAVFTTVVVVESWFDPAPISLSSTVRPATNPIGIPGLHVVGQVNGVAWFLGLLLLACAGVGVVIRYRRSAGDERQQIKWFAYAVAAFILAVAASFAIPDSYAAFNIAIIFGVGVAMPVAILLAVLKYRLYGIDVVVSRTIVYGSLAALITGVYVGIAVGVGTLVGSGGKPNLGLSILATGIVAIGFQPVRERLQRLANRLVYGKRATPYEVLSEFSGRVAETYAADDVLPRMARVLQEGTGAETATVWLRNEDELRPVATSPDGEGVHDPLSLQDGALPEVPGATWAVAVRHHDDILGALSVVKRRGETLTPIEEKLVGDLAYQAGLVLRNVRLTSDLQARLDDLRISRQRLVSAQDEERRRLERNLHDGAQQNLVALKVKLGLVEMLAVKDPAKAGAMLEQLKSDADEALQTLRDLARGIYPPLLADKGLVAALQSQARKATLPVTVDADGISRYAQDVEATVYFCVLEALQNVQKYAEASEATVRLRHEDGALRVDVEDNGKGFDVRAAVRGAGLTNMGDRLDAMSGTLSIDSAPGRGTRVCVTLPVTVGVAA
jgi:signal transduction histidine kinase